MLVPYDMLNQLPTETVDNLIKEFLISQLEDGSFSSTAEQDMQAAMSQCRAALAQAELMVEFSEEDGSVAIRRKEDIISMHSPQD